MFVEECSSVVKQALVKYTDNLTYVITHKSFPRSEFDFLKRDYYNGNPTIGPRSSCRG